ncbi:MAG: chemotaxis protein CheW [Gemmatimonadales bacterium]
MSTESGDFLLVRAGTRSVGLRLQDVVEVSELGEVFPVPSHAPAIRGVTPARGRLVPLLHLGAFLGSGSCPPERASTAVLAEFEGHRVCLEVDEADVLTRETMLPVPPDQSLPWARAMVQRTDGFIPILNLSALRARIAEPENRS